MMSRSLARTLRHASPVFALGLVALGGSGCSAARWLADGLGGEPPPRTAATGYGPGTAAALPAPVRAGAPTDPADGRDGDAEPAGTTSVYVVSPALTWGELQLHRPHAVTGELYRSHHRTPECTAESWAPHDAGAQPNRPHAEEVVRAAHVPFGVRSTFLPFGPALSLDRDVMGDRVMRSGAYLVQRGPVCFGTFLEFSFYWAIGGDTPSGGLTYW